MKGFWLKHAHTFWLSFYQRFKPSGVAGLAARTADYVMLGCDVVHEVRCPLGSTLTRPYATAECYGGLRSIRVGGGVQQCTETCKMQLTGRSFFNGKIGMRIPERSCFNGSNGIGVYTKWYSAGRKRILNY